MHINELVSTCNDTPNRVALSLHSKTHVKLFYFSPYCSKILLTHSLLKNVNNKTMSIILILHCLFHDLSFFVKTRTFI